MDGLRSIRKDLLPTFDNICSEKSKRKCSFHDKSNFPNKFRKLTYYQTNKQGFPIDECEYCSEVEDWVYTPPNYGSSFASPSTLSTLPLCRLCLLRPCVKAVKFDSFSILSMEVMHDYEGDKAKIREKMIEGLEDIGKEIFGVEYIESHGIPPCLVDMMLSYFEGVDEVDGCN